MQDFAPKHANTPPGSGFPTAEDLAAYIDGTLSKTERARVTEHLASCEDCYAIYMETLHFQLESSLAEPEGVAEAEVKRFPSPVEGRAAKSPMVAASKAALWLPLAALLLLSVGGGSFLTYRLLALPPLTTTPASPPIASLPPVDPGKSSPLWLGPTYRGEGGGEEAKLDEASFRMGVQLVNLQATLQAGQARESQDVIARILNLMKPQPFTDDLQKGYTGITIALEKRPPAEFLPEAARLARESRDSFDTTSLDLGQWVEAGRLAAMARNPSFFQQADARTFLRRLRWNDKLGLHEVKLDPTTRASLDRISEVVSRGNLRASDYAELQQQLEKILEHLYPQA
jgi:hypothetical protein